MPLYPFQSEDGEVIDRFYKMADAPPIGTQIQWEGKTYTRVFQAQIDDAGIERKTWKYPFVSSSLPRHLPGCKHTRDGKPIITSQRHEREVLARAEYVRE